MGKKAMAQASNEHRFRKRATNQNFNRRIQDNLMNESKKETRTLLVALTSAQILNECIDELKGTNFYNQSFKKATNNYEQVLSKKCNNQVDIVFDYDEGIAIAMLESFDEITSELATLDPNKIIQLGQIIKGLKDETIQFEVKEENAG